MHVHLHIKRDKRSDITLVCTSHLSTVNAFRDSVKSFYVITDGESSRVFGQRGTWDHTDPHLIKKSRQVVTLALLFEYFVLHNRTPSVESKKMSSRNTIVTLNKHKGKQCAKNTTKKDLSRSTTGYKSTAYSVSQRPRPSEGSINLELLT